MKSLAGFALGIAMYGMGLINGLGASPLIIIPIGGICVLVGTIVLMVIVFKQSN